MNIPNQSIPLVGQGPQMQMLNAAVVVTPALIDKLNAWSKQTGIPFQEIGQTIFRLGLIGLSMNIDKMPIGVAEAITCIPLTEHEKKIKFN